MTRVDTESQPLTTFLTPDGSFQWKALPTGAANSPAFFSNFLEQMLHYKVERDEKGNLIYEHRNKVLLSRDPIVEAANYFDDIIISNKLEKTYGETVQKHFEILERAVERLSFHGCKINVMKCDFVKSKINFLGWIVSHSFIIADPRRVKKVKEFAFPQNKKQIRAFLGLINSLRRVLPIEVVDEIGILAQKTTRLQIRTLRNRHR